MSFLKKFFPIVKDAWLILGIALALFVALEIGLSAFFYVRSFWHLPDPNFRMYADTYSDPLWADQYYKELDEIEKKRSLRWHSYVYWRRMARNGQYINITPEGLRKTNNVTVPEGAKPPLKVFMFGGSTLWGLGTGDNDTIPSIFAREASNKGLTCEVVNYGQYAYVSTQEVIELMRQLQRGNIPDAVIFYDGTNDTFGAFQLNLPGLPFDEIRREKEFNLLESSDLRTVAIQYEIKQLATVRFLNGFLKGFGLQKGLIKSIPLQYENPVSDRKVLAQAVIETYINNIKLVQALAKDYGFKCLFYWQPTIYQKQHLTAYELKSLELDFNYAGMKEHYQDTYTAMQQRSENLKDDPYFHDISSMFSEERGPIYLDFNHMGDKGNARIAQRMAEDFASLINLKSKSTEQQAAIAHKATAYP